MFQEKVGGGCFDIGLQVLRQASHRGGHTFHGWNVDGLRTASTKTVWQKAFCVHLRLGHEGHETSASFSGTFSPSALSHHEVVPTTLRLL